MPQSQRLVAVAALVAAAALGVHHFGDWPHASERDLLVEGWRNPPATARPSVYYLLLNGYVNRDYVEQELEEFQEAGFGGLCLFDMGARGEKSAQPPAGPPFLGPESVQALAQIIRKAGALGMEVDLSVSSSWDMGGSWVAPEDASKTLLHASLEVEGPMEFDGPLPLPDLSPETPKDAGGKPVFLRDVAVVAVRDPQRLPGHEFLFELPAPAPHRVNRIVLYNTSGTEAATGFRLSASDGPAEPGAFFELVQGALEPKEGPQEFRFSPRAARYVRLQVSGGAAASGRVQLGEIELYAVDGTNVLLSHRANRSIDGARLLRFSSALGISQGAAENIHDGVKSGLAGSWSSSGPPPLRIDDPRSVVDLSRSVDGTGRLRWQVPPGKWMILRYVCANTGERLKVPSPNSDGWATDHLSAAATRRYIRQVIARLQPAIGDFRHSALKELYLASYELRGRIWTPDFLEQFYKRRGYDLKPFLPVLEGGVVGGEQASDRVFYDFQKTLGEILVDAYYRAAVETAHEAGLGIESEAGGPGPPIHQVPVDSLLALGSIDSVRGEFWPWRPNAKAIWVVKETASAAHIYGKRRVHMEAFTSTRHWQEGPSDLKPSADRAFAEGMNHVVWHTAAHQPPEAGKPGWVYYAGTHIGPNRVWWPMAQPFLQYLARTSFLLQQGLFVADVLYYYGDQGFNFVMPKQVDPALGFGYDYDVTNAEVLLKRLSVEQGKIALPDGMRYELLVLPDRPDIDLEVLRKIEQLVAKGASIVGPKPQRATGFSGYPHRDHEVKRLAESVWGPCDGVRTRQRGYGSGRVICGQSLKEVLRARGVGPDFQFTAAIAGADIDYIHRRTAHAEIYFVRNKRDRWEDIEAVFRVTGKRPELWLPDSGEIRETIPYEAVAGGTRVPLRLEPFGSVFVVFAAPDDRPHAVRVESEPWSEQPARLLGFSAKQAHLLAFGAARLTVKTNAGHLLRAEAPRLPSPIDLSSDWQLRFRPGWGAPDAVRLDKLISWTEHPHQGVRYYSGIGTYEKTFELDAAWLAPGRVVMLDLGDLWSAARVSVNGKPAGVLWKRPFCADITSVVKAGRNLLRIEVANTWNNRLVGDAVTGRRLTRTNVTASRGVPWAKMPLLRSGLFGPVYLHAGVVVTARPSKE